MNYLLISATILLAGIAIWLLLLIKPQTTDLSLEASIAPRQSVVASLIPKANTTSMLYRKFIDKITHPYMFWVAYFVVTLWVIYLLNIQIKNFSWLGYITIIAAIFIIILVFFPIKYKGLLRLNCPLFDINCCSRWHFEASRCVKYTGIAALPKKVYVDDSHSISINLKLNISTLSNKEPLHIQDSKKGKLIVLQFQQDGSSDQVLEIQLLAAGLVIDGEKIQRQSLILPTLSYCWNCYFPNSGDHVISLIMRVVSQSDIIELGSIQHNVKVAKLDHLTQRQVQLAGIISGGLGIVVLLKQLGVLQKIVSYMFN